MNKGKQLGIELQLDVERRIENRIYPARAQTVYTVEKRIAVPLTGLSRHSDFIYDHMLERNYYG